MNHRFRALALLPALLLLAVSGCASIPAEKMQQHITVKAAPADGPTPVVFFFQHSGGNHGSAGQWVEAFGRAGISSVLIDSAGVRGLPNLYSVQYDSDLKPALDAVRADPRLDLTRYGLMGFSKGGTAAMVSASSLDADDPRPDFVFALYPGELGRCPNNHKAEKTAVHIFYGERDEWGLHKGTIAACKGVAARRDNTLYHSMGDVHHGFDGFHSGSFACCGSRFRYEGDEAAREKLKGLVAEAVERAWGLEVLY